MQRGLSRGWIGGPYSSMDKLHAVKGVEVIQGRFLVVLMLLKQAYKSKLASKQELISKNPIIAMYFGLNFELVPINRTVQYALTY